MEPQKLKKSSICFLAVDLLMPVTTMTDAGADEAIVGVIVEA